MTKGDPRHYQIATLSLLLLWGLFGLDLEVASGVAVVVLATALGVQWLGTRLARLPRFDPKSALISSLSLCLLLRTNQLSLAALAAALTIGSKFLLRVDGRHVFNPTNVGLAVTIALTGSAWVSPGQWGASANFGMLMACLGGLVIHRAARSDVTYAFIGFYALVVFGRALWLGDPLALPLHHLANGAFLLFAFFMISDPKTTPDSRAARLLFALIVALGAGYVHFVLFRPNGLLWSLVLTAPITPVLNRVFPGTRYEWRRLAPIETAVTPLSERSFA